MIATFPRFTSASDKTLLVAKKSFACHTARSMLAINEERDFIEIPIDARKQCMQNLCFKGIQYFGEAKG